MSIYNMVNGANPAVFLILPVLGHHPNWYPRFRDTFLGDPDREATQGKLIVFTRTGGGNRHYYEEENNKIKSLPGFLFDYDEPDDNTYANWVFDIPAQWQNDIELIRLGKLSEVSAEYRKVCADIFPKIADKIHGIFEIYEETDIDEVKG